MKIYRDIQEVENLSKPVLTTGTFDGVHIGHQKILSHLTKSAKAIGGESVVLTFWPHPRMVVFPDDNDLQLLSTLEEKAELLEKFGVDHFIIYPFSKSFSRLSDRAYVEEILVKGIGVEKVAVGYDHRFGKNREGDFSKLQSYGNEYGFGVEEIPAQDVDDVNVSSTKIRKALLAGELDSATQYLSYHYQLKAKVIQGEGIGKTLGFPTANLLVEDVYKLIPKAGVYAVRIEHDGRWHKGMMNIGVRPTVSEAQARSIEVHLFDFDADLYNQEVKIAFVKRIRDEKKFPSVSELQKQLYADKEACLDALSNF